VSRKLTRLMLAGSIAIGATVAPMLGAYAAGQSRFLAVEGNQFHGGQKFDMDYGDTVRWENKDKEDHTITARDNHPKPGGGAYDAWPESNFDKTLEPGKALELTFPKAGQYYYECTIHQGMTGVIDAKDLSSTTTTTSPPPPPTTTTTTRPAAVPPGPTTTTTSTPASSAGTKPPGSASPAPTTTTKPAKDKKKDDKPKEEETTTTTAPLPPPPVDIPDSAIIPVLPGSQTGTTTQNGIEAPTSTPEGEAIALLKSKSGGGEAKKLLIVSGFGLGVLGLGAAGYKWANRSSRYFPA